MANRRARHGVTALLVGLAATACSGSVSVGGNELDTAKLETRIRDEFAKTVTGTIEVSCPRDVKIEQGNTFECTATADDGSTRQVRVTQTDDEGNVRFDAV